jgi:predicted DNA-binding transcriptional regulator YafY
LVDPYGLVAKASTWHLVCSRQGFIMVIRMPDVLEAHISEDKFSRAVDFDLVEFWTTWCSTHESNRPHFPVRMRIKAELLKMLKFFHDPILSGDQESAELDADGWHTMTIHFETFEEARKRLLDFGGAVEIIEPQSLRRSVQDFAEQIVEVYNQRD